MKRITDRKKSDACGKRFRFLNAVRRKLRARRGLTLVEMLSATLIMSFSVLCMAQGVAFGVTQYHKAMNQSESKVLCDTLSEIIRNELSTTQSVRVEDAAQSASRLTFLYSNTYNDETSEMFYSVKKGSGSGSYEETEYGELMYGKKQGGSAITGTLLLSSASYSYYHLGAKVEILADLTDSAGTRTVDLFHVTLTVQDAQGNLLENAFDVLPLNSVSVLT